MITEKQRTMLEELATLEEPISSRTLARSLAHDEIQGRLMELEGRGLVERNQDRSHGNRWKITEAGIQALGVGP